MLTQHVHSPSERETKLSAAPTTTTVTADNSWSATVRQTPSQALQGYKFIQCSHNPKEKENNLPRVTQRENSRARIQPCYLAPESMLRTSAFYCLITEIQHGMFSRPGEETHGELVTTCYTQKRERFSHSRKYIILRPNTCTHPLTLPPTPYPTLIH